MKAIEIGTSKSCIGYEEADDIKIIPNTLGEGFVPSVVSISKNRILAGEDANITKISNSNHTISEVKRLLGKTYSKDDKNFENFKKHLSYDLIEEENKPILIKIDENLYTPEEIYAYIIQKLFQNGTKYGIYKNKVVIAVSDCFGIVKRKLIKKAAKLAGIDESKIQLINESYASALAFELYINKTIENLKHNYNYEIFVGENKNKLNDGIEASPASLINITKKLTIIFDLGGGTFDLTLLSIDQKINKLEFNIKASVGDPNFGCVDFDNKLVDYCIKDFCQKLKINEEDVYKDKKAVQRLKFKCEIAKKIMSRRENVVINVDDFYGKEDLCNYVTRDLFNNICDDLYKKIINKLEYLFKISKITANDINEVLLIGGSTKIPKIHQILCDKFTSKKVISNLDKDKIVIIGAVLYGCEMKKNNRTIIINETLPLSIGIGVFNNDVDSYFKHGNKMYKILKKNSKLPISIKKQFQTQIPPNKQIELNFYEGESKFVKYNQKIRDFNVEVPNIEVGQIIKYDITLEVDINYILKIKIEIPSLEPIEIEVGKFDKDEERIKLKKRLGKCDMKFDFAHGKSELQEYSEHLEKFGEEDKNKALINCCKCCDEILDAYENNYYREDVIENIFLTTRTLFVYYLQRLKIKDKEENDNENIILSIKEKMKNLIKTVGYIENLLEIFKDILRVDKSIFYEIMINYIELMNNEGVNLLMKKNKSRKNYSMIYFRSCYFIIRKIEREIDFSGMGEELNRKYEIQKKINEFSMELISSREKENKSIRFKNLTDIIDSLNNKQYKWLKDTLLLIGDLQKQYDLLSMEEQ